MHGTEISCTTTPSPWASRWNSMNSTGNSISPANNDLHSYKLQPLGSIGRQPSSPARKRYCMLRLGPGGTVC
eukprot:295653-Rhodomonas_salina.2